MTPSSAPGTNSSLATPGLSRPAQVEELVRLYGDMVFDLCESVLESPANAQIVFRSILKAVETESKDLPFVQHARAWILGVACREILTFIRRRGRRRAEPRDHTERMTIDALPEAAERLKRFPHYFRRLTPEDQLLLLLKDKFGLPYPEIAAALSVPENSLKVRRSLALLAIEEWIWENE